MLRVLVMARRTGPDLASGYGRRGLAEQAVEVVGQAMVTDLQNSFDAMAAALVGVHMSEAAARQVYEQTGLGPDNLDCPADR